MIKVITYGTFDMLHYGHVKLLERAKALGDYLIVGITSDDYDKTRGKINNSQSLMERIAAVRETGLADEIIVEEYEGQKIDDIQKYNIDIFTEGSDWEGYFDYLNEYCKVIYLPRTEGISSSEVRTNNRRIRIGIVGCTRYLNKFINESKYVNGADVTAVYYQSSDYDCKVEDLCTDSYKSLLEKVDAVYIISRPENHYKDVKTALLEGKHVLCESPISYTRKECEELFEIARTENLILMDAIKTAYSTAYERLILMIKSGKIGEVLSIDAVCTSIRNEIIDGKSNYLNRWNSVCEWAPTAMLPVFQIFGIEYTEKRYYTYYLDKNKNFDSFTKIDFVYPNGIASIKVAIGAKAESELVICGTKGYMFVPAPWWKTDYFEIRYEDAENNKRFFYNLEGEGIRNELVDFVKSIEIGKRSNNISQNISQSIVGVIEDFNRRDGLFEINKKHD